MTAPVRARRAPRRVDLDLPAPDPSWARQAACRGHDLGPFFAGPGDPIGLGIALAVCRRCPVVEPCRAWAIAVDDQWAVLGATTPRQRARLVARGGAA